MRLLFRLLDIVSLLLQKLFRFLTIDLSLHSLLLDASTSFFLLFLLDFLLLVRLSTKLLIVSLAFLLFLFHSFKLLAESVVETDSLPLDYNLDLVFARKLLLSFLSVLLCKPLSPSVLLLRPKEHVQNSILLFYFAWLFELLLSLAFGLLNLS